MTCDDDTTAIHVEVPRSDRFAFSVELVAADGEAVAAIIAALDDAETTYACHVRDGDGELVAELTVEATVDGDDMTIVCWTDDTTEWEPDTVLSFDLETVSTAMGRYTMLTGSTVTVVRDQTREVGS